MGCDIHMYMEYTYIESKEKAIAEKREPYWNAFSGQLSMHRNYIMFGHLCKDIRYDTEKGFEARGLPDNLGFYTREESRLFITEDGEGENETTLEKAKKWGKKLYNDLEGNPRWCDHPDWHSHTWLTTKEFAKAIANYKRDKNNWGSIVEYEALLAAMKFLEKDKTIEARIVFWFDN